MNILIMALIFGPFILAEGCFYKLSDYLFNYTDTLKRLICFIFSFSLQNDDFIIKSTAFDAFHSIITDYKQDFDKETLDTLTKKMFDRNLKNETDVKLVIPVQDKEGHFKVFKFQIGSGVKEKMLNIKEVS